ncbi:MAG TPA: D-arabinono-1,4-lactone oxidase, partial [Chloroflexota bacterium]|nr:D-arabinono-1,4-lactone oxidase [Chloroflexota bacterium]
GLLRQTWQDYIGSRSAQPLRVYHPTTLDDLRAIVRQAMSANCRVKAVGSGHSFTDVAVTRDFLVETHGLNRVLDLGPDLLRPDTAPETLFAMEAGSVVAALNEALWDAGLGLVNMGGYDGQTIAGVISTSTHGSGLGFEPMSSQVVSLTLVAGNGTVYRVEPADGITDPARWAARHPEILLKQDDDWFRACQVGIGCLGIVYSVILRARPRYYLEEVRTLDVWSRVKQELEAGDVLRENAHYEVLVNPYATNGDHTCLVTRRDEVAEPDGLPADRPQRNVLVELASGIPGAGELLGTFLDTFPTLTPQILDEAMRGIVGNYVDRSYRVFNVGAVNSVPAYGSEIGFTLDQYLAATERVLEIAAQRQELGQAYLTSPFSLRFVRRSDAFLSMMNGADTCMIEFPMLDHTAGGRELLQQIEVEMYRFGGRPHWGLLNFLSGANGLIEAMYPQLPRWLEVFHQINVHGTFDNAFTERCGLSSLGFQRA